MKPPLRLHRVNDRLHRRRILNMRVVLPGMPPEIPQSPGLMRRPQQQVRLMAILYQSVNQICANKPTGTRNQNPFAHAFPL